MVSSLGELDELLGQLNETAGDALPVDEDSPRGRQGSPARVVVPHRWLDDPDDLTVPGGAELPTSGG
jgi:hypothetical protein